MARLPSFRLFRIPVTVYPSFLLIALALGWFSGFTRFDVMAVWVGIVFVSIVVHELGHALTARGFGAGVEVELNGLGGLTRWGIPGGELPPGRRALVAAAGSASGFLLAGGMWLLSREFGPFFGLGGLAIDLLVRVNLVWGLLNWLPIRPLDGGHLLTALLDKVAPRRAEVAARVIFTATAALALAAAFRYQLIFAGILAGWMLLNELGMGRRRQPDVGVPTLSYEEPVTYQEPAMGDGSGEDDGTGPAGQSVDRDE